VLESRADAAMEASQLGAVEARRRAKRVQPRAPERLVDVDVPHPGKRPLVEERSLERGAAARQALPELGGREERVERLVADPGVEIGLRLGRLEE
jgi:hypothetical protein